MSTPAHTVLSVQQFLTKKGMIPMPHHPYSPNLAPSDFCLFPWVKKVLKGNYFANVEEVKQKTAEALKGIKMMSSKTVLSSGKNVLIGVLHQMKSTLKATKV